MRDKIFIKETFCSELDGFFNDIEELVSDEARFNVVKEDVRTRVGHISLKYEGTSLDVMVKCFKYKGVFNTAARRVAGMGSRARSLYDISSKLFEAGLNVPEPIGFKESKQDRNSYYVSLRIADSENLAVLYKDGLDKPKDVAKALASALGKWHLAGALHGDLKWSNILILTLPQGMDVLFVDIDQSRILASMDAKGMAKDMERFYRYAIELKALEWTEELFLPVYEKKLGEELFAELDIEAVKQKARKIFEDRKRR
jgi:tRNA A-37 threonylcarbamoyl transferase component Bud32